METDTMEDSCALTVPSTSSSIGYGSCSSSGDRYLTIRRHTVGPGDPAHEQVLVFECLQEMLYLNLFFVYFEGIRIALYGASPTRSKWSGSSTIAKYKPSITFTIIGPTKSTLL